MRSGVANRALMRPEHLGPNQEQTRWTQAGPRVPGAPPTTPSHACPPFPQAPAGLRPSATPPYSLAKNQARVASPPLFCPQLGPGAPATPAAHGRQDTRWGAGRGSRHLPLAGCWGSWEVGTAVVKALSASGRTRVSAPPAATLCGQGGAGGAPSSPGHSPDLPLRLGHEAPRAPVQERARSPHTEAAPGRVGSARAGAAPWGLGLGGSGPAHTRSLRAHTGGRPLVARAGST